MPTDEGPNPFVGRLVRLLPGPIRRRVSRFLPEGELRRGVLTLVLGTTIAQGILVVSSPILTRLYSPSDLGAFGAATSIVAVLVTVACLTYDAAVALPESDVAAANVLAVSLVVNVVMTLICGLLLFLASPLLLGSLEAPGLGPFLVLIVINQFVGGVALPFTGWAIRNRTFSEIAASRITQNGSAVGVQILVGLASFGPLGLLSADVIGRMAGAVRLARPAWRSSAATFRRVTRQGMRAVAVRYRRFPIFSSGSALLNTLGLQAPLLLLVALYGTHTGGQFLLAQRVAAQPVVLVAGAVGQVFFGEAARLAREQPLALRGLFLRATGTLARAGIVPTVLVMVLAPLLFGPVFGEDWREAGLFTALLAPMYFLTLVTNPTGSTLAVLERQDLHFGREILRLGLVGGAVLSAAALHLPALGAVAVLSAAGCATYVAYGLISWWAIVRHRVEMAPDAAVALEEAPVGVPIAPAQPVSGMRIPTGAGTAPTVVVRAPATYPAERRYVLDVVLTEWLGLPYRLEPEDGPRVVIGLEGDESGRRLTLPDILFGNTPEDWLTERSMPVLPLARLDGQWAVSPGMVDPAGTGADSARAEPLPVLFGEPGAAGPVWRRTPNGLAAPVDLLGGIFFCLTRYEEVVRRTRDQHGRFSAATSLAAAEGFLDRPIADEYVDQLWLAMSATWPHLERRDSTFRLRLTHDVDEPWSALNRPAAAVGRSLAGDLLKRHDAQLAVRRLRALADARSGRIDRDPFNTFDLLMDTSERHGLRSLFYFMAGTTPADIEHRYRLSDPVFSGLLRRIHDRGHEIGLHASYGSHASPDAPATQFDALRRACLAAGFEQPTWGVRQHYLRIENPQTWRNQEMAGFEHDSTLGFADDVGFRAGTCREYPLFDLIAARPLRLRERPLLVMDATLFVYLELDADAGAARARAIVRACRRHRGDAVVLYHNDGLASQGMRRHYEQLVADLVGSG
jgi:O-antigen/teichoic acid export membrane protein